MMLKMQISQAWEQPSVDIAQASINLCQKVGEEVAKQNFTRINKLLYNAKRIFIYSSGHVQKNVGNELLRLFVNCNVYMYEIKGSDEFRTTLQHATKDDLFIIVSLSGETKSVIDIAQRLHMYKIPLISIVRLKNTPLAQLSDENIYIKPLILPTELATEYTSMAGFFVMAELWFISYTKYCIGL